LRSSRGWNIHRLFADSQVAAKAAAKRLLAWIGTLKSFVVQLEHSDEVFDKLCGNRIILIAKETTIEVKPERSFIA
jgi:hypothetical protein